MIGGRSLWSSTTNICIRVLPSSNSNSVHLLWKLIVIAAFIRRQQTRQHIQVWTLTYLFLCFSFSSRRIPRSQLGHTTSHILWLKALPADVTQTLLSSQLKYQKTRILNCVQKWEEFEQVMSILAAHHTSAVAPYRLRAQGTTRCKILCTSPSKIVMALALSPPLRGIRVRGMCVLCGGILVKYSNWATCWNWNFGLWRRTSK